MYPLKFFRRRWWLIVSAIAAVGFLSPAQAQTDLDRAYRIIAGKEFVDLTHSFGADTPVWSGFGQAKIDAGRRSEDAEPYTIAKDGFRATFYEMVGQYGTHVDPPAHFAEDGITMDQIPLKQMILPLVVFDATPLLAKDPNHAFSLDDMRAGRAARPRAEGIVRGAAHRHVQGLGQQPGALQAPPFPAWSLATIKFLSSSAASPRSGTNRSTPTRPTRWSRKPTCCRTATTRSR